jgi:hypothetical protein
MSDSPEPKDARAIFTAQGAAALRDAVADVEPVKTDTESQDTSSATGTNKPEPFKWTIRSGAEKWTDDPAKIASLSDAPIIEGLLREREVATVVGAAKTAKTWFSMDLALKVAAGEPFLGKATHKRKVLYLDYELKEGTLRKRISLLSPHKPEGFFYQCLRGEARLPSVDEIAALVEAEGYGLVVVDSLYRTGWLSEENNNDAVSRELSALHDFTRRTSCSLLAVDHTAKGGGNERSAVDAARGASAKGGFYDALLVLRPTDKGSSPEGTYAILDPVLRDWPRFDTLPLVSFKWDSIRCSVELAGEVERGESDAIATRILEIISQAERDISRADIVRVAGCKDTTARNHLNALVSKGKIVTSTDPTHSQRILYRLPEMAEIPRQTHPNHAA